MINAIHIRDINSISIQEDSRGKIIFVFKANDDYINIDCDIPASLSMSISSDREIDESVLLSTMLKEVRKFGND